MSDKDISVFVDESGSFAPDFNSSRYYLICLVLHDQAADISGAVSILEDSLDAMGLGRNHCIHAGPLVRREKEYAGMRREERRRIFARMMSFIRNADFAYKCFALDKKFLSGETAVHDFLLLKALLREAFAIYAARTEFVDNVQPESYRLFQAADALCTLELARLKLQSGERLSPSEFEFFKGIQGLRKNYLKPISAKLWR